jgi:hypothetical protein
MDSIRSFTKNYLEKLPEEVKPEVKPQAEAPQPGSAGIANAADGFEANVAASQLFGVLEQQTPTQSVVQADPTVDASQLFNYVAVPPLEVAPSPPLYPPEELLGADNPPAAESGFGKTLEEAAEKGIKDAYKKKTTKEFGPDPERKTESEKTNYGTDVGMPENLSTLGGGGGKTVGELEGSWNLFEFGKIDERTEGEYGNAYVKGSTKLLSLSGQVYYNIDPDFENLTFKAGVGAKGSAEIVGAHYEAGFDTPDLNIGDSKVDLNGKTNADAYVGVKGNIEGNISIGKENHIGLGAGAFDGANASISGKIGAGEIADGHGYLAAWAGVGAKAKFEAGFKDGKLNVDWGLGLALGAGAEWDLGVSIDFGKAVDTALDGMREIGLEEPADWIENTGGDVIEFAGDAAKWTGGALEDAGEWSVQAGKDAFEAVENAAKETKEAAEAAAEAARKAAEDAAEAARKAAEEAAKAAQDALDAAAQAAEDAIDAAGDAAGDVVDWLEDLW